MGNRLIGLAKENKVLLLILAVAAVLRFYHLGFQSIWMDEIYTMNITDPKISFGTMINEVNTREGFPYLYFITIKLLHHIFGFDPLVSRSFSAILGLAGVYMMYRFGRQLFSKNAGLVAAALTAFSEYCIYSSQDARPYTLYFFGVLLSFYYMVKFVKDPSLRNAVLYGLVSALLLNINFFSVLNLGSQVLVILFFMALSQKEQRMVFLNHSVVAGAIAVVLFLPNYKILSRLVRFKSSWIPLPKPDSISVIFNDLLGNSEMTLFFMVPLFFYFLFVLFKSKPTSGYADTIANRKVFAFIVLAAWVAVLVMVIFVKTYMDTSLLVSRYFISILPVFLLVFAAAIDWIRNKFVGYLVLASLVAFMLANNIVVKHYYWAPSKTQFREAAAFVIDNNKKNEPVYTSLKYWYDHFFDEAQTKYSLVERPSLEAVITEMAQDSSKIKAFWYVEAHGRPFALSEAAQKFIIENFYVENNYDGLDAWGRHYILLKDAPKSVDISKFKNLQTYNGDSFMSSIETFENNGTLATAKGWAYFDKQAATQSSIDVLLIKDGVAYRFSTQRVSRPDVTSYFKSDFDISNSGFSSVYDISGLSPGKYQVAIYLINKENGKEGLMLTDKFVQK